MPHSSPPPSRNDNHKRRHRTAEHICHVLSPGAAGITRVAAHRTHPPSRAANTIRFSSIPHDGPLIPSSSFSPVDPPAKERVGSPFLTCICRSFDVPSVPGCHNSQPVISSVFSIPALAGVVRGCAHAVVCALDRRTQGPCNVPACTLILTSESLNLQELSIRCVHQVFSLSKPTRSRHSRTVFPHCIDNFSCPHFPNSAPADPPAWQSPALILHPDASLPSATPSLANFLFPPHFLRHRALGFQTS